MFMDTNMKKLLVIRNDKIGDFMLCFPAFAMLKQSAPEWEITALVPPYTAPLAELCPYIDRVLIDSSNKQDKQAQKEGLQAVKHAGFSASISFVSDWYNAKLTWQSGIKYRLAPATKLFQFLYNHRLTQRRSRSEKAEFEYNLDLASRFLRDHHIEIAEPQPPYLTFPTEQIAQKRAELTACLDLDPAKKWLFIHSGTGGSATNLSLEQYAELAKGVLSQFDCQVILTAGSATEAEKAGKLAEMIGSPKVVTHTQNQGLADFSLALACADLFIAGSTGPLHICGALNVPTVGFYPSRLSAIPRRWQPINEPQKHISFCPPKGKATEKNLTLIRIDEALITILPFIQRQWQI